MHTDDNISAALTTGKPRPVNKFKDKSLMNEEMVMFLRKKTKL